MVRPRFLASNSVLYTTHFNHFFDENQLALLNKSGDERIAPSIIIIDVAIMVEIVAHWVFTQLTLAIVNRNCN